MPGVAHDFILFNNVADLPERPPQSPEEYTIQLLQIPLRTLLTDQIIKFKDFLGESQQEALLQRACDALDLMLDAGLKYHREYNILSVVTNFMVPATPIVAALSQQGTTSDISYLIRCLNDQLSRRVSQMKGVYLLDLDAIAGTLGKEAVLDDWFHIFAHNATFSGEWTETRAPPFFLSYERLRVNDFRPSKIDEFHKIAWRHVDAIVRTCSQVDQVKLVILDLDNTLWRGQIAEHYRESAEAPMAIGWPEGLAEAIHHLRARGILVALCSKNDEDIVKERWERAHPFGWLSLDHFVVKKINWQPKPVNVAEILAETSLTPKSVVFVDDSPLEREAMRAAFPEMRIIGENPFLTRSILLRAPETQVAVVTNESSRREAMVRRQIDRERERAVMSREDFLRGLKCALSLEVVHDADHKKFARAVELVNKTNQFNTTGQRWSLSDFGTLFREDGYLIAFSVTDKFTDYGLVGVVVVRGARIEQFVMSCRVLGLEIERAILAIVIGRVRGQWGSPVTASIRATKENMVCRDVYAKGDFVLTEQSGAVSEYIFSSGLAPVVPPHLAVTMPESVDAGAAVHP
jgi:FkbH-like protein